MGDTSPSGRTGRRLPGSSRDSSSPDLPRRPLEGVALRCVDVLIRSFPDGISADELNMAAEVGDSRNALRDLATKAPLWRAVLRFPRVGMTGSCRNLGYRIDAYAEVIEAMENLVKTKCIELEALRRAVHEAGPGYTPDRLQHLLLDKGPAELDPAA